MADGGRPPEIHAIFDALDEVGSRNPLVREAADLLAADVGVGAGYSDAGVRRRLLRRVVDEIETGERPTHRAELLDKLTVGLARPEVRSHVETRLGGWFYGVPLEVWPSVLSATSTWKADDTLLGILWHGLHAETDDVQHTAARVIGTVFENRDEFADRLAALAFTTNLPDRRAAATEALSLGWPNHHELDPLIETGRDHADYAVRHAAVAADLRRGNASDANRSLLIDLLDNSPHISAWSGGLLDLMIEHYPDDDIIFDHYVQNADPDHNRTRYSDVPATFLVLRGYTHRPEARQYLLKLLALDRDQTGSRLPALFMERIPWKEVALAYGDDPDVVEAVQRFASARHPGTLEDHDVYLCSLLARTEPMRDQLLGRIEQRHNHGIGWAIRALIEGWSDDADVHAALSALTDPAGGPVPDAAIRYLPKLFADVEVAMDRLTELAATANNQGAVVDALAGIIELGGSRDDRRTVTILERALDYDMTDMWTTPESALYIGFPEHPRVRDLARSRLGSRDAPLAAIAYGFRNDPEMRSTIAEDIRPLSAGLRGRLLESLTTTPATDTTATALLERHDTEPDPVAKIVAATAYIRRLKTLDAVTEQVIETFTEQAQALGPDHHERRAAAFCALAELGRLDRLTDLHEPLPPGEVVQIPGPVLGDRTVFYRYVCRYWDELKSALGDDYDHRFGYRSNQGREFWPHVLAVAHDYPATYPDIARKLNDDPYLINTTAAVGYLSRIEPGSSRLLEATVNLLRGIHAGSHNDVQFPWTALQVLADQYADDPRIHTWLDTELEQVEQTRSM